MGVADKLWDALTNVVKMNERVVGLAATVKSQQARIESLTERVARLEAQVETVVRVAAARQDEGARQDKPAAPRRQDLSLSR
jgi:cell division protein FtsB